MPPNLDRSRSAPQAEGNLCIDKFLELCYGISCALDVEGTVCAVSENWDDLVVRTGRTDLLRNAILGKPVLDLLPSDDELRTAFCFALASLAEGKQKQHVQALDYGTASKPVALLWVFHALRDEEKVTGYVVQGLDGTPELVARRALLDRERKSRELKATCERLSEEISDLKRQLDLRITGHTSPVPALLKAIEGKPDAFGGELCRLAMEASGALFATLATAVSASGGFHHTAQYNAQEFEHFAEVADGFEQTAGTGPAGLAVRNGCATKFDYLPEREDLTAWAPLAEQCGYQCIWALPLEDPDGLYGALLLYFAEPDKALTVDQYSTLAALCQTAVPLLRLSDSYAAVLCRAEVKPHAVSAEPRPESVRTLAGVLSEEFSNLLTGVLGHSSLAVAEIGDSHAALGDIHAIERAARNAARLTRRLSAICGSSRRATTSVDLSHYLKQYAQRDRAGFFPDGPAEVILPANPCPTHADTASLEVMLDGMAEHARMVMNGGTPTWSVAEDEDSAVLRLAYTGTASEPTGWYEGTLPAHPHVTIPELFFAREAARTLGGDVSFVEHGATTELTLTLPLARAAVQT